MEADQITLRPLRVLEGHSDYVRAVALSPDGRTLVTGSSDTTAILWDLEKGTRMCTFKGHIGVVWAVAMSADGKEIVTGSVDRTAILWSDSGSVLITFRGHTGGVSSVALCATVRLLVTGGGPGDHSIIIWSLDTGNLEGILLGHTDPVRSVAISADGVLVASGSGDGTLRVWDTGPMHQKHLFQGHKDTVMSVAFSGDSRVVVSGSIDGTVNLVDLNSATSVRTFDLLHNGRPINSVALSLDGDLLLTGSSDRTAKVVQVVTGKVLFSCEGHTSSVRAVALSSDLRRVVTGSWDKTAALFELPEIEGVESVAVAEEAIPSSESAHATAPLSTVSGRIVNDESTSESSGHRLTVEGEVDKGGVLDTIRRDPSRQALDNEHEPALPSPPAPQDEVKASLYVAPTPPAVLRAEQHQVVEDVDEMKKPQVTVEQQTQRLEEMSLESRRKSQEDA